VGPRPLFDEHIIYFASSNTYCDTEDQDQDEDVSLFQDVYRCRCKGRLILKDNADSLTLTPPIEPTKIRQCTQTKAKSNVSTKDHTCSQFGMSAPLPSNPVPSLRPNIVLASCLGISEYSNRQHRQTIRPPRHIFCDTALCLAVKPLIPVIICALQARPSLPSQAP
jgi:hypothetical protein